jgi:hypothetical protein
MTFAQAAADAGTSVGVITASFLLGAFILKLVDFVKYALKSDWNGVMTLAITWAVGFVAVQVFIETQWGDEVSIGEERLDGLSTMSKIVFGLAAPAVAALLYDAKKAVDNTDTASTPRLFNKDEQLRQAGVKAALNIAPAPEQRGERTEGS